MNIISTDPIWINTAAELAEFCAKWQQQAAIAVDTEFMRSDTFYPKVGLLQIGDGKGCYLIDPLLITDVQPLRDLMTNTQVTKVLHSCSEDLDVFQCWLNVIPEPIFDTQIATAFAGLGYSLSYANLVKLLLNTEIPKDETRSDWLQRPLSVAQLKYAALDVAHMLIVYGKLLVQLKASERLAWVKNDCADLIVKAKSQPDFAEAYKDVGLAWKLHQQELWILRELGIWREQESRARNIPRNRLIKEIAMWEIARKKPDSVSALEKIEDLPSKTLRNDAEFLLDLVRRSLATSADQWPDKVDPPLSPEQGPVIKAMKDFIRTFAETHQLPPEILIRRKDYEFIVRTKMHSGEYQLPARFKGWRFNFIGEKLLEVVRSSFP